MGKYALSIIILFSFLTACHKGSLKNKSDVEHKHTNALIDETSPYLLQHAHNPVNWNPWSDVALDKAKAEDKMIIVSIGYSACHWCHVMEHESFEDSTVAAIMNEHFITIKVDREERPDIDDVYMTACQLSSGRGCGWPLNAFTLPNGKPVFAATYFPKDKWINILQQFIKLKKESPEKLEEYAVNLEKGYESMNAIELVADDYSFDNNDIKTSTELFKKQIDPREGGRNGAPKFPMPTNYEYLLEYSQLFGDVEAERLSYVTLDKMAAGGIYDALAGGFARYSTDAIWKTPHFEKMMYDNGQLLDLYSHGFQKSKNPVYKRVVDQTIDWLKTEMMDKSGGFYSALDADSEGEEGKFYVWTEEELKAALPNEDDYNLIKEKYRITKSGNWEHGNNILHTAKTNAQLAKQFNISEEEVLNKLIAHRKTLKVVRSSRIRPGLDDKILTSWNALASHGLLEAYKAFGNEEYLELATKNIQFILREQMQSDGRLNRNFKEGRSTINAFLDDYALVIRALMNVYSCTFEEKYLFKAEKLTNYVMTHFEDEGTPYFNYNSDLDKALVSRPREMADNVIPSSNSIMAENLFKLGLYLYKEEWVNRAKQMTNQTAAQILATKSPSFYSNWMRTMIDLTEPTYEIAIVGKNWKEKLKELNQNYLPNVITLGGAKEGKLALLESKLQEGQTTIYVCFNKSCKMPVTEVSKALELMD